jgi:hypothetical protein
VTTIRDAEGATGRPAPVIPRQVPRLDGHWLPVDDPPTTVAPIRVLHLPDLDLAARPTTSAPDWRRWLGPGLASAVALVGLLAMLLCLVPGLAAGLAPGLAGGASADKLFGLPGADPALPVEGLDGLAPGTAPQLVDLAVANPLDEPITVSSVAPAVDWAPGDCPTSAWRIGPTTRPILPAAASGVITLAIGLAAQAPAACQGRTVPFAVLVAATTAAGRTVQVTAGGSVGTGRLGSPRVLAESQGDHVVVTPLAPPDGPTPTDYAVRAFRRDGSTTVICERATEQPCVDSATPVGGPSTYQALARIGSWQQVGVPIRVWTPPPAPRLSLGTPGATNPRLHLDAGAATDAYRVTVEVDGIVVIRTDVAAGQPLHGDLPLPALAAGVHHAIPAASGHERNVGPELTFVTGPAGRLAAGVGPS